MVKPPRFMFFAGLLVSKLPREFRVNMDVKKCFCPRRSPAVSIKG